MKIKLLSSVAIGGTVRKAGDEIEVEAIVGKDLIHRKRAVSLESPKVELTITSDAIAEAPKSRRKKTEDAEPTE
jgi:hypothetical protein